MRAIFLSSETIYFLFGMLLLVTSCQADEENNADNNETDEISALPETPIFPNDNPSSAAKIELGRALFWDPILSGAKDVACVSCHHPSAGYADNRQLSAGVGGIGFGTNRSSGELVQRNSPTIINTAFNGMDVNGNYDPTTATMFWDSRAFGLEEQALLPILSKEEMRGETIAEADIVDTLLQRLNALPAYRSLFSAAFGGNTITETHLTQALATFQRSIVANNSPFDQYMRGNTQAMSEEAVQGMNRFITVGCADCHNGGMFSDFELHTLSVPDHPLISDDGATGNFDFRTPTLRNLSFTAPYMHNGSFDDLRDVLNFYNDISGRNPDSQNLNVNNNEIDQDARNLRVNNNDINEIITFLDALNDPNFDQTVPTSVPSGLSVGGNIEN